MNDRDTGHGRREAATLAQPSEPAGPSLTTAPAPPGADTVIRVNIPLITKVLWALIGTLIVLGVAAAAAAGSQTLPYNLTRFFDGDQKTNFPTTAKTLLLLTATLLLLVCWQAARSRRSPAARGWLALSLCTAFAFLDESTYLHQSLSEVMNKLGDFDGPLAYAWTVIYWPAAVLAGIFVLRTMGSMQPAVRRMLLPGGILYGAGALLFEPLKSHFAETYGEISLHQKLTAAASDSLQLVGLTLLVCALLHAARHLTGSVVLVLDGPAPKD